MGIRESFVRKVIAPLWAHKERTPYLSHVKTIESMHSWPRSRVFHYQLQRLQGMLTYACEQTDYYGDRFRQAGVSPSDLENISDLQWFPILRKDDIRANKERMIGRNISKSLLIPGKTSGSTGVSVEFYVDEDCRQWKRGATVVYDRWSGWDIGEPVGAIWGNPECYQHWRLYLRNLLLTRHIYLDTLKMDEKRMLAFHAKLVKTRPTILFGHAHSLFLFAVFLQSRGLRNVRPRGIISTCMVLHDFERRTIEDVFRCRVTNRYGCEEVSLIACECPQGNMHLNCDSLIVELLRDGKPVPPGEPGAVVVTDLVNRGMPFIRYQVGDVAVLSEKVSCACGCSYPMLSSLEGRVADFVVTPDGNYISGISLTENFALQLQGVKQMQIVQEKIDFLRFRVVKGDLFSEQSLVEINRLAQERFGKRMRWEIECVDSIQSEVSGKYRFCISRIANPFSY